MVAQNRFQSVEILKPRQVRFHLFICIKTGFYHRNARTHTPSYPASSGAGAVGKLVEYPHILQQQVQNKDAFTDANLWPFQDREQLLIPEDHHHLWRRGRLQHSTLQSREELGNELRCCMAEAIPQHLFQEAWQRSFTLILELCSPNNSIAYPSGFGKGEVQRTHKDFTVP